MDTISKLGKTNGINSGTDMPSIDMDGAFSKQFRSSGSQIVPPPSWANMSLVEKTRSTVIKASILYFMFKIKKSWIRDCYRRIQMSFCVCI